MDIARGRTAEAESSPRSETFTGTVWHDPILQTPEGARVGNVFFAPGARTHWHRHEHGQVLHVTSGQGRVTTAGGSPQTIGVGDTVWIAPGEEHWHGADASSYLVHYSVALGKTDWGRAVSDADYAGAEATSRPPRR